jgi:hypothetical protein
VSDADHDSGTGTLDAEHPEVKSLTDKGISHDQLTKLVNGASIEHPAVSPSSTPLSTTSSTGSSAATPATATTVPTLDTSVQQALAASGPEFQYMLEGDNQYAPQAAAGQAQQVVAPEAPTPPQQTLSQQQYNQLIAQMVPGAFGNG